jgi:hypothetical protein
LKPFGVCTANAREGEQVLKCYRRIDLEDAFSRYLPPQTATSPHASNINRLGGVQPATRGTADPPRSATSRRSNGAGEDGGSGVAGLPLRSGSCSGSQPGFSSLDQGGSGVAAQSTEAREEHDDWWEATL